MSLVEDEPAASAMEGTRAPMPPAPRIIGPLHSLSPTAERILEAAKRVGIRGGYRALSFQSIASEAKIPKSTVVYHFHSKETLIAALLESLIHEQNLESVAAMEALPPGSERVHMLLEYQRRIAKNTDYWQLLFVLLPEIMRRGKLRSRFQEVLDWYWAIVLHSLGLPSQDANGRSLLPLASVILAVLEGLVLQFSIAPAGEFDLEGRFAVWEEIIGPYLQHLSETLPSHSG